MGRRSSFLDSSLRIAGIVDIVELVSKKPLYFSELKKSSKIKFKQSFLKYLRFCYEKGFLKKKEGYIIKESHGEFRTYEQGHEIVYYSITSKGKRFLELVKL